MFVYASLSTHALTLESCCISSDMCARARCLCVDPHIHLRATFVPPGPCSSLFSYRLSVEEFLISSHFSLILETPILCRRVGDVRGDFGKDSKRRDRS